MADTCHASATQDLIGIGVRIGLYCQWLAAFIAGSSLPLEVAPIQTTTIGFQIAILCSLILVTVRGTLVDQEVLIVLPLTFGGFLAVHIFNPALPPRADSEDASSASVIRFFIIMQVFSVLVAYNSWFWWRGVLALESDTCHYYVFVFAKVDILRLRVFALVISTLCSALVATVEVLLITWLTSIVLGAGPRKALWHLFWARLPLLTDPRETPRWKTWCANGLALVSMAYVVVMIEVTISWNLLDDANAVDSIGQLLPLVVGVTGLLRILYLSVKNAIEY